MHTTLLSRKQYRASTALKVLAKRANPKLGLSVMLQEYVIKFSGESAREDSEKYLTGFQKSVGAHSVAGTDEVGRGSMFGDVVAACVVLPKDHGIQGIADSKKISEKKRVRIDEEISKIGVYGIGVATSEEVDKFNIIKATHLAVLRAYYECSSKCDIDLLFCDGGLDIREHLNIPSRSIIKGDLYCEQVAAASIVAKVYRDNQMYFYDDLWPEYGFKNHKGYGTKMHTDAIKKYGRTPFHRSTFGICKTAKERIA